MEEALEAATRVPTWFPIDTAPKDGTEIIAYSETGFTDVMLIRWIAPCDFMTDAELEQMSEVDADEPGWFFADFVQGALLDDQCQPTHWMPLPSPPEREVSK